MVKVSKNKKVRIKIEKINLPMDPKAEAIHVEGYRKRLNFHVPILSIKRHNNQEDRDDHDRESSRIASRETGSSRIPFSWEQSPGKPKKKNPGFDEESETPRPRLPPARWHPNINHEHQHRTDAGFDENEVSSDAVDMMSLSEAIDFIERSERVREPETDLSGEIYYRHSPNFIMERFLPDASALASASALAASRNMMTDFPYNDSCSFSEVCARKRRYASSCSSRKGCGLEMLFLFPWRMKHKICGVKGDVTVGGPRACGGGVVGKERKESQSPVSF